MQQWKISKETTKMIALGLIKRIEVDYGTPFYLMYPNIFRENVRAFKGAFEKYYDKVLVGYSFKTNYVPAISGLAREEGCYAEVVSSMEYKMASRIGFDAKKIIFNGPVKTTEDIFFALNEGSIVNLDSQYEVDSLLSYKKQNPSKEVKIGLRINIQLNDPNGKSVIQAGLKIGRFGFSSQHLEEVIPLLKENNITINSLHGHTSSSDRSIENYLIIAGELLRVAKRFSLSNVEYFNIGGGFFGAAAEGIDVEGKPSYSDYASSITSFLCDDEWFIKQKPTIVIEPGVSVVANVFSFVTKIYQHKTVRDKHFIIVDGSVFDVKPSMHKYNLPFSLLNVDAGTETRKITTDVVGSTCMEKDIILSQVELTAPKKGDYIILHGVGAYTHVLTPTFINYVSPIFALENANIRLIRRRQSLNDIFNLFDV